MATAVRARPRLVSWLFTPLRGVASWRAPPLGNSSTPALVETRIPGGTGVTSSR